MDRCPDCDYVLENAVPHVCSPLIDCQKCGRRHEDQPQDWPCFTSSGAGNMACIPMPVGIPMFDSRGFGHWHPETGISHSGPLEDCKL